jgi:hypothetical protein
MKSVRIHSQKGYVALMAAIVISLMLLVMVGKESVSGSLLRSVVLGIENKERSESLARGCSAIVLAAVVSDAAFAGNTTLLFGTDSQGEQRCDVSSIAEGDSGTGSVRFQVQAASGGAFTVLEVAADSSAETASLHEMATFQP